MTWRLAQSLVVLRDQIDAMYPNRDKRTDGVISGYPGAISGHNVNAAGVVCAMDITTGDYPGGITMAQSYPLADAIREELLVAPRGLYTYIIHHMEPPYVPTPGKYIAHGGPASLWQWIPYTGTDAHTSHIHISVDEDIPTGGTGSGEDPYDMTDPWNLGGVSAQSGSITQIQEDDMFTDADRAMLQDMAKRAKTTDDRVTAGVNAQPARADKRVADVGDVLAINDAIIKATQAQSDVTRKYLMDALLSIAQGVGELKTKPAAVAAAPTVTVDVQALASALAPLLNVSQVDPFVTAIRNLKFAAQ